MSCAAPVPSHSWNGRRMFVPNTKTRHSMTIHSFVPSLSTVPYTPGAPEPLRSVQYGASRLFGRAVFGIGGTVQQSLSSAVASIPGTTYPLESIETPLYVTPLYLYAGV